MPAIGPIRDLKDTAKISALCKETDAPVFITKNGYGDMVVLSMEAYENLQFESEVYAKLKEAERESATTQTRYSSKEVLAAIREQLHVSG